MSGITSGVIAASATAGALVGMGLRAGGLARPFNVIGAITAGSSAASAWGFSPGPTLFGLAAHVLAMLMCGLAFAALAARLGRGFARAALAAVIVALAQFLVSWLRARLLGTGLSTLLPLGDRLALAVVLAASLLLGMRFALTRRTETERSRGSE